MVPKREELCSPKLLWIFRTMSTHYLPKCVQIPLQYPTYITSKLIFSEFILNSDFFVLKFPGEKTHNNPEISYVQKE